MNNPTRMSPLTAMFIGLFGLGAVSITAGTLIVMNGMRIIDNKAVSVLSMVDKTVESLPELIENLQPTLSHVLSDRRAPEYAKNIEVKVDFAPTRNGGFAPALTIINKGDEVISLLAVRVAALDERRVPVREWTEVVATPLAFEEDWRGPLLPHATRHVVLSGRVHTEAGQTPASYVAAYEISDVRVWQANDNAPVRSASAAP